MASSSASPRLNPPPPRKPTIDTGVPAMDAEEEDALTRPHHPAGLYALKFLHQQRQQDRIGFQSVGPRTIGGMRHLAASTNSTNQKSCSCKGSSKCLTLYCPCFARGRLCQSCTCSSCVNDGGPTDHVVKRTRAVVDHLTRYPYAFRPSAQDVKDAAQQLRKTRDDDDDEEEPGIRIFSHPQATESEYQELPASFYSEPLGPGAGLATTRVHPKVFRDSNNNNDNDNNHAKRPRSPSPKKEQEQKTKQRLVRKKKVLWNTTTRREHVLVTTMAAETSLEAFGRYQQEALQDTLHQLSQCVNGNHDDTEEDNEDGQTETIADAVETMRQDLQSIQTAVEAAELDVMTRLYKAKQPHGLAGSGGGGRPKEGDDDDEKKQQANNESAKDAEEQLYCHDDLPPPLASTAYVKEEDLRERTLLAAQESALLQETARIIRRKARELCERRLNSATSQE